MYRTPRVVAGVMAHLAFLLTAYHASSAVGQPSDEAPTDHAAESHAETITPSSETRGLNRSMFYAAQHAYDKSLEEFKAGNIEEPEVVYRWSLRLMKTHQAAGEDRIAPAAADHLRRMTELAGLVENTSDKKNAALHKLAVKYYRAEAESFLAKAMAKPENVASLSPDDAVKAAEAYLGAVLDGNHQQAVDLAIPGSLATSKRLMDSIKGLISGKSISVLAIQTSGRRTTVLMEEALPVGTPSDGRARAQFTVALEPKGDRWLVTTFSIHKSARTQNDNSVGSTTEPTTGKTATQPPNAADPFGTPPAAVPKETKVIVLKHAKANELATTIANLNRASGAVDYAIAVDDRTNRIIVRGSTERIAEILDLIEQLDVPASESQTTESRTGYGGINQPRGNYGGAR